MLDKHTIERLQRLKEIGMKSNYKYKTSDGSNGNEIWAIARWGKLRTIMLRNEWQSKTPESFGVDRVVFS